MLVGEVIGYEDGDVVDGIARRIGDRLTYFTVREEDPFGRREARLYGVRIVDDQSSL